jgi:hypothetical protein
MMTDGLDRILRSVRPDRRPFLRQLVEKGAFAPPVVSSFSMSGLQALHDPPSAGPDLDGGSVQQPTEPRRARRWRRRRHTGDADSSRTVSRRRLFGLLGGAAAAGAGLAVAGTGLQPDPAAATPGNPMILGGANDAGPNQTSLTSTGSPTFRVNNSVASSSVITLQANSSGTAVAASGNPAVAASSFTAQLRLLNPNGGLPHQPPPSGNQGDLYVNGSGELWFCTASGSPGTWVQLATPFAAITPTRVYDSRPGTAPLNSNPKAPIQDGGIVDVDVTNNGSNVPSTARAVVGNLTVVNNGGPIGSHLTVFPNGSPVPGTSNINWGSSHEAGLQVIANSFTSQVNTANHLISVNCGGGSTDFLVDIFGYYA